VVKITIGRGRELQGAEANLIQRLVIDAEGLVGVLDELMHGEGGVIRLDDSIGDLVRG